MSTRRLGWTFLALACASAVAAQRLPKPPEAGAILDRYVTVTGGQAAYDRIENQVMKATVTHDGQTIEQVTYYQTRRGDFRSIEVSGGKTTETGVNGGVVWRRTGESAELIESDAERGPILASAFLLPEGRWRKFYPDLVWETSVLGGDGEPCQRPCDQLAATTFLGGTERLWYDIQSGLLVREEFEHANGDEISTLDGYLDSDGVMVARRITFESNHQTIAVTVNSVEFNQSLPASTFELPEEIARLLKKESGQ